MGKIPSEVISPQDHYAAVEKVGVRGVAKVKVQARPLVQRSTLKWKRPEAFSPLITSSSKQENYELVTRNVSESELEVQLVVKSMTDKNWGSHILTVDNELGEQTYKVCGSCHSILIVKFSI